MMSFDDHTRMVDDLVWTQDKEKFRCNGETNHYRTLIDLKEGICRYSRDGIFNVLIKSFVHSFRIDRMGI